MLVSRYGDPGAPRVHRAGSLSGGPGSSPVTSGTFRGLVLPRGSGSVTLYSLFSESSPGTVEGNWVFVTSGVSAEFRGHSGDCSLLVPSWLPGTAGRENVGTDRSGASHCHRSFPQETVKHCVTGAVLVIHFRSLLFPLSNSPHPSFPGTLAKVPTPAVPDVPVSCHAALRSWECRRQVMWPVP